MSANYGGPASPAPAGGHKGLIVLLGVMSAIGPMTMDMYLPALPQMVLDLDASEAAIQTTLTGSLIGMALGQLVLGPLSDAVGRRIPLLVGLIVHVVSSVLHRRSH
ncbi:Major Facilitator Superfamily protein [Paramicrobacterium humi]|uniref:Major Facilitator Superfamily protein n=1 Tax=Paramicrobacterium humi TaxID=640635 RepID=A0A1H4PN98_9MICO|nr:MFS transporter [Microbacterium humi]SEC08672.1 Major Facilitator Superfamily protein [Microbacterium humi]